VLNVILGFVLTGLFGNWILQGWQQRSWLRQQWFLGAEKDYTALKSLWDEIAEFSGARLARMYRLAAVVRLAPFETVEARLKEYDVSVLVWNEKFQSFLVRLVRFTSGTALSYSLEQIVQPHFVACGRQLEQLFNQRKADGALDVSQVRALTHSLDRLSHELTNFNRDVLRVVQDQRARTYQGVKVVLGPHTIRHFGNWELFKALFHSGIEPYYVIRPPFDLEVPGRAGL